MREIMALAGAGLTIFGGAAGLVLLVKASGSAEFKNKETLWGLFIIGMLAGLILLGATLGR
jgi:hypothetical protein